MGETVEVNVVLQASERETSWLRRCERAFRAAVHIIAGAAWIGMTPAVIAQGNPAPGAVPGTEVARSPAAVSPDGLPLVAPGPPPDLILLYTGRVVGYVEPCG